MAQIRGTAGYHLGSTNNFGQSNSSATNDPSPLDAIRQQTSKIEDILDSLSEPVKPYVFLSLELQRALAYPRYHKRLTSGPSYVPAIGRFLIVVTFLEDALRIITQWSDQLTYLRDYRHSEIHTRLGAAT